MMPQLIRLATMTSKTNPVCRVCGTLLNHENWWESDRKNPYYICKKCHMKAKGKKLSRTNRECPQFLGIHVAERVLSHVFKNVKRMPMNNPGFDFICNKGKKIDVKSSCANTTIGINKNRFAFHIYRNKIADYFLCLAFDNRTDITPLYAWLLPAEKFNKFSSATITLKTIHKWDEYQLNIDKVAACCDMMKK